jgi:hypothetical protein
MVVGALVGLLVGGSIGVWYLALLAGFLGSTTAVVVRNLVLARGAGLGPDDSKTPVLVIVYAAVTSLGAGSLALEVAEHSGLGGAPVLIGTMAGLFASILLSMLMVTYHTNPGETPKLRARR